MDKGSNISFPLDSGSTVYNGSGISVGGKASTDILHAAGGTTKIKTLNGESMLGEGNIVIDPSSVPVSLSWYNRTSSQQDATINLTIGDTTVNLFPNIFKLFKAGKVSTSESLSIELTANPGVSGVPQVPTSLCQWSIPLADSNTAASLVAVNSRRGSSIVHEAEHIKNHIWQYIGYTPQRDNDEVDAYLLTYIYDKITQVFYKHKDNKE